MGRAHSLLAAHRLQCPQPGTDQDEAGGRAGGEVHAPAGARPGAADVSGVRGQGRLEAHSFQGLGGDDPEGL